MFTNLEIDIDTLPKVEAVKLKPISKSYIKILFINIGIQYGILFGILILARAFVKRDLISHVFWYAFSLLLVLCILQCIICVLSFKKRGYTLRNHDIIYVRGLLNHKRTIVPFIRIQHLETKQSFIAKRFNLASLHLYTAGESGGDLSINGLTLDEATKINEMLTTKIN